MKKTSVYLSEPEERRLEELSREVGRPKAEIIREAISSYVPGDRGEGDFALFDSGEGPGDSIADVDEEQLLNGFGEDPPGK